MTAAKCLYRAGQKLTTLLLLAFVMVLAAQPAQAVQPDEVLEDPALEARARELSANLRCLVCQNQSIDDSDAPLARDLRLIVRERLVAGDSNDEVISFLVARYGDFVLLKPPVSTRTIFLWAAPFLLLIMAGLLVFRYLATASSGTRAKYAQSVTPLTDEEKSKLDKVLKSDGQ